MVVDHIVDRKDFLRKSLMVAEAAAVTGAVLAI